MSGDGIGEREYRIQKMKEFSLLSLHFTLLTFHF